MVMSRTVRGQIGPFEESSGTIQQNDTRASHAGAGWGGCVNENNADGDVRAWQKDGNEGGSRQGFFVWEERTRSNNKDSTG